MTNYEKIETVSGDELIVWTNAEGVTSFIPCDPANSDYQRYLRWLENPDAEENGTIS
jgi:hypothetical protein